MPFSKGLVHIEGEPAPVPDLVVRALHTRIGEIWQAGGLVYDGPKKGDQVVIREGMFGGYESILMPGSLAASASECCSRCQMIAMLRLIGMRV